MVNELFCQLGARRKGDIHVKFKPVFYNSVLDHPEGDVDSHIDGCAKIYIRGVPLRSIDRWAWISTGSIYTRLGDKHGLFLALVYHSVKELLIWRIPPKEWQSGG